VCEDPALSRAFYLTGPTASGKSAVALTFAERFGAEIIALDSMTLYRGMDIGTAKPSSADRARVPHHLLDVLEPWQGASVAEYRAWAIEAAREIQSRGRIALFVGGTPLYLKALLRGLFEGPGRDDAIRERLDAEAAQHGSRHLHERLRSRDPAAAARIHVNDLRRIIRALEVIELTGQPISDWQTQHEHSASGAQAIALRLPRESLHARINRRTNDMFDQGLVDEMRRLLSLPHPLHHVPAQAVGYFEAGQLLGGRVTREQAIERAQARTRQIAKRQETWCRGLAEVESFEIGDAEPATEIAARIRVRWLEKMDGSASRKTAD
jgi:tRNA dimethylallyltransferase